MNHQPFEDWLLDDKKLTVEEKRELDAHLRNCRRCAAISETGFALRAARVVPPAPGFAARFQTRLAAQKIAERRQRLWGTFILILVGLGMFGWLVAPYIYAFIASPAQWLTVTVSYFLFIVTSFQVVTEMFSVFSEIVPNILPVYVWMILASALAGFSLLWTVSIWRFSSAPQGVPA
jgi:hypothetical protein